MKRVVKLGGRAQSASELPSLIASAWRSEPGALCIVHGGGDEISALQRKLGGAPTFTGGRRVTTAADIDIIRMALSGLVNKRLVSSFVAAGAPAVGLSGEDAALIGALPLNVDEFGHVGMPSLINTGVIEALWNGGFLPVISPLGANYKGPGGDSVGDSSGNSKSGGVLTDTVLAVGSFTGAALNINGDDAAAAIAIALHADELLLIADVAGVLDDSREVIAELDVDRARSLIAAGVAVGGMAAKLEAAHTALAGGVARVRIANLSALTDPNSGTVVTLVPVGARS